MNKLVFFQLSLFCFFLVTFSFSNYAVGIEVPRNPNEKKKEDKPPPKPDLGKAAMSVAKAVVNPKQLAFVAIGTVVQAAMKAYNAMKDSAEWEKKENDADRKLSDLLEEYRQAISAEFTKFKGKGVTSDPCDTDHLGFCPLGFDNAWPSSSKIEEESDANKEEASSWADKIDIPKEKCTFNCLHKVGKKGKLKVCKELSNLKINCVSCGDEKCKAKSIEQCGDKPMCIAVDVEVTKTENI